MGIAAPKLAALVLALLAMSGTAAAVDSFPEWGRVVNEAGLRAE